jgi:hypothetical protein
VIADDFEIAQHRSCPARLVVVAAAVVFVFVEVVDLAERIAQRVALGLVEAVEIGALPRLAIAIGIASGCGRVRQAGRSIQQ